MALTGCLLEVAIGDSAGRVIRRHQGAPDVIREEIAPDARLQFFINEDTAQAEAGAIRRPHEGWIFGHYFCEVRRARAEISDQAFERVEMVADVVGDPNPAIGGTVEGELERGEKSLTARYSSGDEPQLPEGLPPTSF